MQTKEVTDLKLQRVDGEFRITEKWSGQDVPPPWEGSPPPGNGSNGNGSNGGGGRGGTFTFLPIWDLGGNVVLEPDIGSGDMSGLLIWKELADGVLDCRIALDLTSSRAAPKTSAGTGTGSYQFYIPDRGNDNIDLRPFIPPAPDFDNNGDFLGHLFYREAGSAQFWIGGKHPHAGCKFTFREYRDPAHTNPRPKILVQLREDEWKPSDIAGKDWNLVISLPYTILP